MSKLFVADPVVLKKECIKIGDGADMFVENNKKIFSTVREIMSSSYISPAARAIGEKILSFEDELDEISSLFPSAVIFNSNKNVLRYPFINSHSKGDMNAQKI